MMKTTYQAITQAGSIEEKVPATGVPSKAKRRSCRGFTLIELLIVITIIGILVTILAPNVIELIVGAEKTKAEAAFKAYVTAITQYKQTYNYYPPLFVDDNPVNLSEGDNRDKFIMALKGKKLVGDRWQPLAGKDEIRHNRKGRQFHPFSEEEFNAEGFLVDTWGNRHINVIVDYDHDGFIQLPDAGDIEIPQLNGHRIKENIVIYVLGKDDPETGGENVFSWSTVDD